MESFNSSSGRIRRKLYRIHASAPKVRKNVSESEDSTKTFPLIAEPIKPNLFQNVATDYVKSKIFQNVVISPEALKQKLPSYSSKDKTNLELNDIIKDSNQLNAIFDKSERKLGANPKRTEGIPRRRKIPFHELVSSAKEFLEKREKEKKKVKEDILTNFKALEEALPTLEHLIEKKNKDDAKPRAAKSFSKQDAEMMEDIQTYQQVLNNAEYVADPIGTIAAQLRRRIQSGSL